MKKFSITICFLLLSQISSFAQEGNENEEGNTTTDKDSIEIPFTEEVPKPINMTEICKKIGYPKKALNSGISGAVILRFKVNKEGEYEDHKIVKSSHYLLTNAVEKEIKNLIFTPGIQNGVVKKVWMTIPFYFKLRTPKKQ